MLGRSQSDHEEVTLMSRQKQALDEDQVSALVSVVGRIQQIVVSMPEQGGGGSSLAVNTTQDRSASTMSCSSSHLWESFTLDVYTCFVSPFPSMTGSAAALVLPFHARPLGPPNTLEKVGLKCLCCQDQTGSCSCIERHPKCVCMEMPDATNTRSFRSFISSIPNEIETD